MEAISAVPAVMNAYEVTTIINNINALYSNVINQLITIIIGGLAFVGVFLPLIFGYFQKRKINADKMELAKKIDSEIQAAKTLLIEKMKEELNAERSIILKSIETMKTEMHLEVKNIQAQAEARAYHLQTAANIKDKLYDSAFNSCAKAIRNYSTVKDEFSLIRLIENVLLAEIFPSLKKKDFDNDELLEENYQKLCESIAKLNNSGRYSDNLVEIKKAYKDALAR